MLVLVTQDQVTRGGTRSNPLLMENPFAGQVECLQEGEEEEGYLTKMTGEGRELSDCGFFGDVLSFYYPLDLSSSQFARAYPVP